MAGNEQEVEVDLGNALADMEKDIFQDGSEDESPLALEAMEDPAGFNPDDRSAKADDEEDDDASDAGESADKGDEGDGKADQDRDAEGRFKGKDRDADNREDRQGKRNGIPPARLREEADARRAAEARAEEANRKLDEVLARLNQPAPQAPQQTQETKAAETVPDIFTDPEGYDRHVNARVQQQVEPVQRELQKMRVETSFAIAHARHGDTYLDADKAVAALDRNNPNDRAVMKQILEAPNPGEAMVSWHKQQKTLQEMGDPATYRERVKADILKDPEIRKALLADLREQANTGKGGRPNTVTKVPRSLNSATGGQGARSSSAADHDNSERGVFGSAFD